jgi:hypothetical protein
LLLQADTSKNKQRIERIVDAVNEAIVRYPVVTGAEIMRKGSTCILAILAIAGTAQAESYSIVDLGKGHADEWHVDLA